MTNRTEVEAAVFRRLLAHLDSRKDVQNIDLMNLAGFCRNCLSKWYVSAAAEKGETISYEQAREMVYGMPYEEWKRLYQKEATAEQQKSFSELLMILVASSILVFGVILFLFRDVKPAITILIIAILGIAGSYLALFITGTPLNVGSYTGLIMIVGIIGENSIFTFLQFKETLQDKSVDESVIYAISTRLRPKLMTALGAIIALMPLALGIGAGAQLHQPLAIAVIGGFIIALPLLLIVLPTALRLLYRNTKRMEVVNIPGGM